MPKLGITGTRRGISAAQKDTAVDYLAKEDISELHHGDCLGVDEEIHGVLCKDCKIVIHPPLVSTLRAFCEGDIILPPLPYIERNHAIVNDTAKLIAFPAGPEELRSGAWATIRYAIRIGKPVIIIWPDGNLEER